MHVRHRWRLIFSPYKAEKRSVGTLHMRLTTPLKATIIPALRVEPETAPLGVARRSFGMTKRHSSRLDWHCFRLNRGEYETSTDPGRRISRQLTIYAIINEWGDWFRRLRRYGRLADID